MTMGRLVMCRGVSINVQNLMHYRADAVPTPPISRMEGLMRLKECIINLGKFCLSYTWHAYLIREAAE